MSNIKPIVKLYYYDQTGNGDILDWALTADYEIALEGFNMRQASMDDLERNGSCEYLKGTVWHIEDGFTEWSNTYERWECVDDIKNVLLDWLEHMEMENSLLYEEVISMKDYEVHRFLDHNRIGFGVLA